MAVLLATGFCRTMIFAFCYVCRQGSDKPALYRSCDNDTHGQAHPVQVVSVRRVMRYRNQRTCPSGTVRRRFLCLSSRSAFWPVCVPFCSTSSAPAEGCHDRLHTFLTSVTDAPFLNFKSSFQCISRKFALRLENAFGALPLARQRP